MTSKLSAPLNAEQRAAIRRIESFRQRFGDGHFYLACHAALPLALTPDLLYCLWVNFQQDSHQELLDIPWIAVSDLILSNLCEEVGYELYEMDTPTRNELLKQLQNNSRFGLERILELADFVMAYVDQELDHPDLDTRNFAETQRWGALAYKNSEEAAHSIAMIFTQLHPDDKVELVHMAALLKTLEKPLDEFQPLLLYANAMADFARGNSEAATDKLTKLLNQDNEIQVAQVSLPVPDPLKVIVLQSEPLTTKTEKSLIVRFRETLLTVKFRCILIILLAVVLPLFAGIMYLIRDNINYSFFVITSKVGSVSSSPASTPQAQQSPQSIPTVPRDISFQFPQASCGDKATNYNATQYPVFVNDGDLDAIRKKYCGDAFEVISSKTGIRAVQIASFTSLQKAQSFSQAISGEVGEPKTVVSITKCILTITNSLVPLRIQPEEFAHELTRVKTGDYTSSDYKVTKFAAQDEGWFLIEAEGRKGWIRDDIWTINKKTKTCP